jgi:hypothetical protein
MVMVVVAFVATWLIPLALATYAWLKTQRRLGTKDELIALAGSLSGWSVVLMLAHL